MKYDDGTSSDNISINILNRVWKQLGLPTDECGDVANMIKKIAAMCVGNGQFEIEIDMRGRSNYDNIPCTRCW